MRFFADLHLHSRFSRATSRELTLPRLHASAQRKGLTVVGTGDITHPEWLEEIATQLVPAEEGLFRLRPDLAAEADQAVEPACRGEVRFLLQGEVSSIYKHGGEVRKVHNLVFCPDLPTARRLLGTLDRLGNVRSDGRPILGLSSRDVLEIVLECGPGGHLVPAHVWTPWFSVLGSKSGYDSVDACFEDLTQHVFALETGLSSDPAMNWRVSSLDRFALLSNSDAHSPGNLGREANEFDGPLSYPALFESLRGAGRGAPGFAGTVEFFPEEGKYHLDGHRKCSCRLEPAESRATGGRCPACGGPLTIGVLHRVEELSDRPEGARSPVARPFARLVPLAELVGECLGVGPASRRVGELCGRLLSRVGPELTLLRDAPAEDVARAAGPLVAEAVRRVREGRLLVEAGYDGEFGTVRLFRPEERTELAGQGRLFPSAPKPAATPRVPPSPVRAAAPRRPAREAEEEGAAEDPVLDGLNPEQRAAVVAPAGPLAVVAGPGTGKTRTLTCRIAHRILADGVPASRVLAVTFTHRAADELTERLGALLGRSRAAEITVCTLHRLGLRLLRQERESAGLPEDFAVLGEDEAVALLAGREGLAARDARAALEQIHRADRGDTPGCDAEALERSYRAALTERGAVDLDGLITRPVALLEADPDLRRRWIGRFDHVAVDEYQDLDAPQARLIELLAPRAADVTVIGDPDQSIYGFRGADPALFGRFLSERPGARQISLLRNYRSTPQILAVAARALSHGAPLLAAAPEGARVQRVTVADERAEAAFVAAEIARLLGGINSRDANADRGEGPRRIGLGDVAVLYRLKALRPSLEEALCAEGIPCQVAGEEPALLRGRGKMLLERLRRIPATASAGAAVRDQLPRVGLAPEHLTGSAWMAAGAACTSVGELLERVSLETPEEGCDRRAERVSLLTLHAAKGLEFPVVFLVGCEDGLLPRARESEEEERGGGEEEERRLFYVGITRAQTLLYLTLAGSRLLHGERARRRPSPFLGELGAGLVDDRTLVDRPRAGGRRQLRLF